MNIIFGASGRVGSIIVNELAKHDFSIRAVIGKNTPDFPSNVEVFRTDLFNADDVAAAFKGGTTAVLLTPENPQSKDIIGETKHLIRNYNEAIKASGIRKIIGLSSIGAHLKSGTGNVLMSRMLEEGFSDLTVDKLFVRPSYYFSNWLAFSDVVKQSRQLPTFFPEHLKVDMNSPFDVGTFIASMIAGERVPANHNVVELAGPEQYSSADVAIAMSRAVSEEIKPQSLPKDSWKTTLTSAGFTENTTANMIEMTQAVVDQRLVPQNPKAVERLPTTLAEYLATTLAKE